MEGIRGIRKQACHEYIEAKDLTSIHGIGNGVHEIYQPQV
jgi:hypothetical protein